ncbi:hypothetical protein Sjap_003099 [Stephania japonica]|uniref:Uncharacterized protein n=1 Tax=Stephania japonica TaxID=461633 RepID=A0AAP0PV48_9MAGN
MHNLLFLCILILGVIFDNLNINVNYSRERSNHAIIKSYNMNINGFVAMLDEAEAEAISKDPKVVSVFLNQGRTKHTTRSWNFLGIEKDNKALPGSIWEKARYGEDTIIGNLDTGVWPESHSFNDHGLGPIPKKWRGSCQNDAKKGVPCNRKLIGAKYFNAGYKAYAKEMNYSVTVENSARDEDGHGTHTLSTAGGGFVRGASVFGYGKGTAKGGSPKARVAAYKVCWDALPDGGECFDADILDAFDNAITDRVDVLSLSLGGPPSDYLNDGIAIGSFHAVQAGIIVVCSAGNSGPSDSTASNIAPWILTVGASTMDREFRSLVVLGNNKTLVGQSLSSKKLPPKKYPLISGLDAPAPNASASDAQICMIGSLDPKKVKGKVVICLRGGNGRVEKGAAAELAGAAGMILCNDEFSGDEIIADAHLLPASHINLKDGLEVYKYVYNAKNPVAYITPVKTQTGVVPAPFMASFSSKGPNYITPEILKPDITAPGVSVIASYTQAKAPTGLDIDKRRVQFNVESGTSMSCPHVSGVVGLLKTLHPDWSPAAIKSAILTTAKTRDNRLKAMLNSSSEQATPFSYGSGQVRPNRAADPGLVYDLNITDYLNFMCGAGYTPTQLQGIYTEKLYKCPKTYNISLDLNYPSITVPSLFGSATVTREVKNVGTPGTYKALIHAPPGILVTVKPDTLTFKTKGEVKKFKVTLHDELAGTAKGEIPNKVPRDYVFGKLSWTDGKHYVRSPIVVKVAAN